LEFPIGITDMSIVKRLGCDYKVITFNLFDKI